MTLFSVIRSSRRIRAANGMTKSGTAAVSTAARLESTLCSAQVMSMKGRATLKKPITTRWP